METKRKCLNEAAAHYFISHEEETLLFSKSDDIFDTLSALDLTWDMGRGVVHVMCKGGGGVTACP